MERLTKPKNVNAHKWRQARKCVLQLAGQWPNWLQYTEELRAAGVKGVEGLAEERFADCLIEGGVHAVYEKLVGGEAADPPVVEEKKSDKSDFVRSGGVPVLPGELLTRERAEGLGWQREPGKVGEPTGEDLLWVAQSIAVDLTPEDCPGLSLWGLLCWARLNQREFWSLMGKSFFEKLAKDRKRVGRGSGKPVLELIAKLRAATAALEDSGADEEGTGDAS